MKILLDRFDLIMSLFGLFFYLLRLPGDIFDNPGVFQHPNQTDDEPPAW
jgi:hypothetical protein